MITTKQVLGWAKSDRFWMLYYIFFLPVAAAFLFTEADSKTWLWWFGLSVAIVMTCELAYFVIKHTRK